MPSNHPLLLLALAPAVAYARGADASQPHPHRGTLTPYKAQPPSKYGLDVGNVPLKQLRSGKPVWQLVTRVAIPLAASHSCGHSPATRHVPHG